MCVFQTVGNEQLIKYSLPTGRIDQTLSSECVGNREQGVVV